MKLRVLIASILFSLSVAGYTQQIKPSNWDFGKVKQWNNPKAEFLFTNTSNKELYFLPTVQNRDIYIFIEQVKLQPGESTLIEIQYYTEYLGKFSETVNLWTSTSQSPFQLTLRGTIVSFHPNALTVCPSIDSRENQLTSTFDIDISTEFNGRALEDYKVVFESSQNLERKTIKGTKGSVEGLTPNLYRVNISKPGYRNIDTMMYLNRNSKPLLFTLNSTEPTKPEVILEDPIVKEEPVLVAEPIELEKDSIIEDVEEVEETITEEKIVALPADTASISKDGMLSTSKFAYNNITFLIDVSASMNRDEKLPLLKYSMIEMIKILRPEDKVTIITYSSKAEVLLNSVSGADKALLSEAILKLEAKGQSYGSEGVDLAYNLAKENFIESGNNEIILVSDGLFNSKSFSEGKLYRKAIFQYKTQNVRFSTIAFGKSKNALEFLEKLAGYGGGDYIQIPDELIAKTILIQTIMDHSYIQDNL